MNKVWIIWLWIRSFLSTVEDDIGEDESDSGVGSIPPHDDDDSLDIISQSCIN